MLLTEDLYLSEEYHKWAGLLPFTYGGTIEEVAAKEEQGDKPSHDEPKFAPATRI